MSVSKSAFAAKFGAHCRNPNFAWSYINHDEKFAIFGAWSHHAEGDHQLILSDDWAVRRGRRTNGYGQSIRHIEYIVEDNYGLKTFVQHAEDPDSEGPMKTGSFEETLVDKELFKSGSDYFAVPLPVERPFEDSAPGDLYEGESRQVLQTRYERNPYARKACIDEHGCKCSICSFDFESSYGELGREYIHVHHLVPVSERGTRYKVDPKKDLVPVCPNCHAMIHRFNKTRTPEEIREMLSAKDSASL